MLYRVVLALRVLCIQGPMPRTKLVCILGICPWIHRALNESSLYVKSLTLSLLGLYDVRTWQRGEGFAHNPVAAATTGLCVKLTGRHLPVRWKHLGSNALTHTHQYQRATTPCHAFRAPLAHLPARDQHGGCWQLEGKENSGHTSSFLPSCCYPKSNFWVSLSVPPSFQLSRKRMFLQCDVHCKTDSGAQRRHAGSFRPWHLKNIT